VNQWHRRKACRNCAKTKKRKSSRTCEISKEKNQQDKHIIETVVWGFIDKWRKKFSTMLIREKNSMKEKREEKHAHQMSRRRERERKIITGEAKV